MASRRHVRYTPLDAEERDEAGGRRGKEEDLRFVYTPKSFDKIPWKSICLALVLLSLGSLLLFLSLFIFTGHMGGDRSQAFGLLALGIVSFLPGMQVLNPFSLSLSLSQFLVGFVQLGFMGEMWLSVYRIRLCRSGFVIAEMGVLDFLQGRVLGSEDLLLVVIILIFEDMEHVCMEVVFAYVGFTFFLRELDIESFFFFFFSFLLFEFKGFRVVEI